MAVRTLANAPGICYNRSKKRESAVPSIPGRRPSAVLEVPVMRSELFSVAVCLFYVVFQLLPLFLYDDLIESILAKDRSWFRYLFACLCSLLLLTLFSSYATGRLHYQLLVFDMDMSLIPGAFIQHFGLHLLLQALAIVLALGKYLWSVIRRRRRFRWAFFGIELLFAAGCCAAGYGLIRDRRVLPFGKELDAVYALAFALLLFGIYRGLRGVLQSRKPASAASSGADEAEYRRVLDERKRLGAQGDYASQIPLLLKATGLTLSPFQRSTIWNLLGLAYENTASPERALSCYQTALQFDTGNPWALNNLALLQAERGENRRALKNMERALREKEKRDGELGLFYANYGYICGLAGKRDKAENYLKKAETAGYDAAAVRRLRGRLGLN